MFGFNTNMQIRNNNFNQPAFQAKFLNSQSLKMIADYAVEKGKFQALNTARKNIDKCRFSTYLRVDIFKEENKCGISFTRYVPKDNVIVPKYMDDYIITKVKTYETTKTSNPLKFGLEKIIKLGNNAPHNNLFKEVVIKGRRKVI